MPATDIIIRKMRAADLDETARIEAENFSTPWKKKDFEHYLDDPQALFLAAVIEQQITGYIGCLYAADEGDITNVSVDAAFRRRGIGRELVRTLLAESERRGCARIFLEVRQSNEAAVRLYEMHGFQEIGVRKNYYQKPVEDALLMRYENKG